MQYRKLIELKKLEGNPRVIRDKQFKTLCNSIRDNPEYFEARPLIISNRTGEMIIIAGNMRYEAARSLKLADVPTFLMEGLTEEKEREIIIRDNISNGDWNFDTLAKEWSNLPLAEWGIGLPKDFFNEPGEEAFVPVSEKDEGLRKFIEAREKSRLMGQFKSEVNFWVCLIFQSYDEKKEFLKLFSEDEVLYGMYADGRAFAEKCGIELSKTLDKKIKIPIIEEGLSKRVML